MNEYQKAQFNKLRQKYVDSDSRQLIVSMEEALLKLIQKEAMVNNPVFQEIVKEANKKITEINELLLNDSKLSTEERTRLFEARNLWTFMFEQFGPVIARRDLNLLEEAIAYQLNK